MPAASRTPSTSLIRSSVSGGHGAAALAHHDQVGLAPGAVDHLVEGGPDRPHEQQDAEDHPDTEHDAEGGQGRAQRPGSQLTQRQGVERAQHRSSYAAAGSASVCSDARYSAARWAGAALDLAGQLAVAQEDHAIGGRRGGGVVGDHDDRVALLLVELAEDAQHLAARLRVEVAGRLVGEHELGREKQGAGDRDPLLLAAGELGGEMVDAVAQPDPVEQHACALAHGRVAPLGDDRGQGHVLLRGERREQVEELEDEADVVAAQLGQLLVVEPLVVAAGDGDRPGGRRFERPDDVQQGALPGARRSHDRDHLARLDHEVDAVEGAHLDRPLAVVHVQIVRLDRGCGHAWETTSGPAIAHP